MSRLLPVLVALALGACTSTGDGASEDVADPGAGAGGADLDAVCLVDGDCVAAASTCCECPTFAVAAGAGYHDACEEVECEPAQGCPALEAACEVGQCALRCAPVVTETLCDVGFSRDAAGCLVDECALPPSAPPACERDADCVQVAADCCGCERGGEDTAVAADQVAAHEAALDCPDEPACPGVNVCSPGAAPRCLRGQCVLADEGETDEGPGPDGGAGPDHADLCGTDDFGACPAGEVCVLNAADAPEAASLDVGACRPI